MRIIHHVTLLLLFLSDGRNVEEWYDGLIDSLFTEVQDVLLSVYISFFGHSLFFCVTNRKTCPYITWKIETKNSKRKRKSGSIMRRDRICNADLRCGGICDAVVPEPQQSASASPRIAIKLRLNCKWMRISRNTQARNAIARPLQAKFLDWDL